MAPKVCYIDDQDDPELKTLAQCALREQVVAVDLEGDLARDGRMSLMQVAFGCGNKVYILDLYTCPDLLRGSDLVAILKDANVVKVIHDCKNDACGMEGQFGISLAGIFDTQSAHYVLSGQDKLQLQVGMNSVLKQYAGQQNTLKDEVKHRRGVWEQRPLPARLLDYAAQDVVHLVAVYHKMKKKMKGISSSMYNTVMELSQMKAMRAVNRSKARAGGGEMMVESAVPKPSAAQELKATSAAFTQFLRAQPQHKTKPDDKENTNQNKTNAKHDKNKNKNENNTTNNKLGITASDLANALDAWRSAEQRAGRSWRGGRDKIVRQVLKRLTAKPNNPKTTKHSQNPGSRQGVIEQAVHRMMSPGERARLEADKGGVTVSTVAPGQVIPVGGHVTTKITVRNGGKLTRELRSVTLLRGEEGGFQVVGRPVLPVSLGPSQSASVTVRWAPRVEGVACNVLVVSLSSFAISRFLEFRAGDASLLHTLKPSAPYKPPPRPRARPPPPSHVVLPPSAGGGGLATPVGTYLIPRDFASRMSLGEVEETLQEGVAAMAGPDRARAMRSYSRYWKDLLWAEELQLSRDLASFNLTGDKATVLSKRGAAELALHVPGLAENRPSVIKGDSVRVRLTSDPAQAWVGRAVSIHREEVGLRFSPRFHQLYTPGTRLEVEFMLPRMPLRVFHQGMGQAARLPPDTLFPSAPLAARPPRVARFDPISPHLASNPPQQAAVLAILQGVCRPVPYLLFGPPGTGKTTTVVEAVLQSLRCRGMPDDFRVLVCAPTNAAADVVCERMAAPLGPITDKGEMLRLMAFSRSPSQVAPAVMEFTLHNGESDGFETPAVEEILSRRVVVCTLATAGKLHNMGVPRGHFNMIVIDEAGQAQEPEAVAPVATLLGPDGQLVLAGDVQQLGPVIHCPVAKKRGLETSLMERLMSRDVYGKDVGRWPASLGYDGRVLTKLTLNFRSHPLLLDLPNTLFYDCELQPSADMEAVSNCLHWPGLENPHVPMMFEGVAGKDEREASSPSWFNADEAVAVLRYVEGLTRARLPVKVRQTDIGVITPYNKQAQKIQRLLRGECYGDVKVGSTEMFQGSEKRVIIISTVRSSREFVAWDRAHQIGFLDNPKRFNVAVTRAACLLIVVGNPTVLAQDACWGALLRQCVSHGAYRGVSLPDERATTDEEELARTLSDMFLDDAEEEGEGEGEGGGESVMMQEEAMAMPEYEA